VEVSGLRGWYAVRAVPRLALLGCAVLAVGVFAALRTWSDTTGALLPLVVAAAAAASGFAFDDPALPVTAVTPRARWARTTRLGVAALPVVPWAVVLALLPEAVVLDEGRWWVVGVAACLLAAGASALAAARHHVSPGAAVASGAALLAILPLVAGSFLGWEPVFPIGAFPDGVLALWSAVAVLGALLWVTAHHQGT
jgi:hypothetical protein